MNDHDREAVSDGGAESLDPAASDDRDGGEVAAGLRENDHTIPTGTEKQDVLLEAVRRGPILSTLRLGPASATELSETVDMSRSTVHRATKTLQDYDLIRRSDGEYELTSVGRTVAVKVESFGEQIWTALALEPFLNTIDMDGIPIEHFVDARITRPTPRQPHTSIQRIVELVEESDSLRMLSTVLSPIYVDVGYREMMDGMQIEAVFDEEAIEIMVSQYADKAFETIRTGNFDVYSHQGLPFELFIADDGVGMAAHDEDGIARLLVECDDPSAIEWAEEIYERHWAEAEPLLLSSP